MPCPLSCIVRSFLPPSLTVMAICVAPAHDPHEVSKRCSVLPSGGCRHSTTACNYTCIQSIVQKFFDSVDRPLDDLASGYLRDHLR